MSGQNLVPSTLTAEIRGVARSVGEQFDDDIVGSLAAFCDLFLRWNAKINLSAIDSLEELVARHLLDAFASRRYVHDHDRVIDVGSGGGLPAIPLALSRPLAHFDLFEPIAKKVAFLRTAVRELGLTGRVRISPRRIDHAALGTNDARFDVAMSRATFAPGYWLSVGRKLIRSGGTVLVFATTEFLETGEGSARSFGYARDRHLWAFGST